MGSSRTVLVVEDDPVVRGATALALRRKGFTVVTAGDGREAVRLAGDQPPDAAVVNMLLPGASGFQVAEAVKDATDGRAPVVMLSDYLSPDYQNYAFALGVDRFLARPLAAAKLADVVAALCPPVGGSMMLPVAAAGA